MLAAQLLLPLVARHPHWVALQLSARLHRPIAIESMQGHWSISGPWFVLDGVRVGNPGGGTPLLIPRAELALDLGSALQPSRHLFNLHVSALQVDVTRTLDGRWQINGIGAGERGQHKLSLPHVSLDLWLRDLRVNITDQGSDRNYRLMADRLRVSLGSGRVRLGARLRRAGSTAMFRAAGDFRADGRAGRLWLSADQLDLASLAGDIDLDGYTAQQGHGHLAAWLDWKNARLVHSRVQLDLADLVVRGPQRSQAQVAVLKGTLAVRGLSDGYDLRWTGAAGGSLAVVMHQPATTGGRVRLAARDLRLAPLIPWLALRPSLSPALAHWTGAGRPRGTLDRAALQWSRRAGIESMTVAFSGLGIDPVGELPGVDHLHGELRGDAKALSLSLPPQQATITRAGDAAKPLALARVSGSFAAWHEDLGWHIGIDPLDLAGEGYAGQLRGELVLPDGEDSPLVDIYTRIDHADVTATNLFLPASISSNTRAWLDRALVSGQIDGGSALIRGRLADWPFIHHEGRFEAQVALSGLTVDYAEGWPRLQNADATARFVDNSMQVQVSGGTAKGVQLLQAIAGIADFSDPVMTLDAKVSGSGQSLLDLARTTPIAKKQNDALSKIQLGGQIDAGFQLSLPLGKSDDLTLSGQAQISNADLSAPEWKLQLADLDGPLQFDAEGLHAGPLSANVRGQPSTLDLRIGGASHDPRTELAARLSGNFSLADLAQDQPSLIWIGEASTGRAPFQIGFDIQRGAVGEAARQQLSVDSSLDGIALKLPAPLAKPAAGSLPLHLTMGLPISGSKVDVSLGDRLRGRFALGNADRPLAAALTLGGGAPAQLPSRGLRIRGSTNRLDLSGWVQNTIAGSGSDDAGPTLESLDVRAEHAMLFGQDFAHMRIQASPQPDGLSLDADSAGLAGHFKVATDLSKRGITAQLKRLYWPRDKAPPPTPGSAPSKADAAAKAAKAAKPAKAAPAAGDPARTGIDPSVLPAFHLVVDDLRLGEAKLGQARLETWSTPKGMHIDQLRALSRSVQITASGDWTGSANNSHTHMRIDFAAQSLGSLLGTLGFDGIVDGGTTRAHLDASWPGAPSSITLSNMDGKLAVKVSDGRIPEVPAPGVGRLLGLVSLAELPRRLGLDFGDVFGKGFGFDSITGDFALGNGNATTNNLEIQGSAAQIRITGRTGLRVHDYDQQVRVVPHVGNTLPVVGAVVGGPVGAAAGFAVQGLLGSGLNKAASARYSITGTWNKPVMTMVEKHAATKAARSRKSAPAPASAASAGRR